MYTLIISEYSSLVTEEFRVRISRQERNFLVQDEVDHSLYWVEFQQDVLMVALERSNKACTECSHQKDLVETRSIEIQISGLNTTSFHLYNLIQSRY